MKDNKPKNKPADRRKPAAKATSRTGSAGPKPAGRKNPAKDEESGAMPRKKFPTGARKPIDSPRTSRRREEGEAGPKRRTGTGASGAEGPKRVSRTSPSSRPVSRSSRSADGYANDPGSERRRPAGRNSPSTEGYANDQSYDRRRPASRNSRTADGPSDNPRSSDRRTTGRSSQTDRPTERPYTGRSSSDAPKRRTSPPSRTGGGRTTERDPFWKPFGQRAEYEEIPIPERVERAPKTRPRPDPAAKPIGQPRPLPFEPMRLNKFLSHCGICARRQAAEFVKKGLVTVNGETEPNPSYMVLPSDRITFKGQPVRLEERKVYLLMNKPKDVITTANDEKGRKTVLDLVEKTVSERIFPVGRLDRQTTGLLLLTNDGELAEKLAHPSHKVQKIYQVTLERPLHKDDIERIRKGVTLEDGVALVDSLHYIGESKKDIEIGLHLGKNRIVRRIFEHLGYEVVKLDRTYYAGLTKKDIGRGHFRHLTEKEVIMLKHFK